MGVSGYNSGFLFEIPKDYNSEEIGNKLEDFELLQKLGDGGNGFAIKVKSKKNHKIYVIKKSKYSENRDDQIELILLTKLNHPNICKCLSYFKDNKNECYLIMNLYSNKDLYRYLKAHIKLKKNIEEENIWSIFNQCLEALTYLHEKGYIHRDIKLGNIFMDEDGKIVLGDFGLSAMFDQNEFNKLPYNEQILLNFEPIHCGTPDFMAPEVESIPEGQMGYYDQRADVYSMGICFYGLLYHNYPVINEQFNYQNFLINDTKYDYELRKIIYNMLIPNFNQRPNSSDVYKHFKKQYIKKYVANTSVCSVVQCLFSFPNFVNYFFDNNDISLAFQTPYKKEIFPLLYSIKNNINNLDDLLEKAFVLKKELLKGENKIKDNVEIPPDEVINSILNALYYELNIITPNNKMNYPRNKNIYKDYNNYINHFNERFCSIISKNFTGVLMKSLECKQNNCKGKYITFQKFNFVTFDVNNYVNLNLKININNLFKYYNSTYSSFKNNEYIECNSCRKMSKHLLNKKLYSLPNNLILYLDKTKCKNNKNNINIDFDEKLIINDEINKNNPYEYYLVGVISEIKNTNNGKKKYVSFIKKDKYWINCDNKSIDGRKPVNFTDIKKYGSIISLFYYDEKRASSINNNINNSNNICFNNNNFKINNKQNINLNQYYSQEFMNKYINNKLYNNTIRYNNNNNNAFNWQVMNPQVVINNNINNLNNNINQNNLYYSNAGNNSLNNNKGFVNNNIMFNNFMNNNGMNFNNNYG